MTKERNNDEVFRQLSNVDWNTTGRKLTALVIRVTGTATLAKGITAEDIAQSVIVKTLSGQRKWDPSRGELLPWLFAQVRSELSNLLDSQGTQNEFFLTDSNEDGEDTVDVQDQIEFKAMDDGIFADAKPQTPEALLIKSETLEAKTDIVLQAIDGISELQDLFDAITETYEVDVQTIAKILNVPVTDIYNRMKRLRNRIARIQQTIRD